MSDAPRFLDEASRASFIEVSSSHADYCWLEEPETSSIYRGRSASADPDREIDLRTGDLVFDGHDGHGRPPNSMPMIPITRQLSS